MATPPTLWHRAQRSSSICFLFFISNVFLCVSNCALFCLLTIVFGYRIQGIAQSALTSFCIEEDWGLQSRFQSCYPHLSHQAVETVQLPAIQLLVTNIPTDLTKEGLSCILNLKVILKIKLVRRREEVKILNCTTFHLHH